MTYGASGFYCTPKVQAKLGILCLNNGTWNGTQIVEPNFMEDATTPQTSIPGWTDYGYLFYMMHDAFPYGGYYAAGAGGQFIYVIPEFNIVIGFTASDDPFYPQLILDYILQFIEDDAPVITINSPIANQAFATSSPSFNVRVVEEHVDEMWYTLDGGIDNFTFTENGTIDQDAWSLLPDGSVNLQFYVMDITRRVGFAEVIIIKNTEKTIPGFNLSMIFLMIFCTSAVLIIRRKKNSKNK